jgi:hypothetical protein
MIWITFLFIISIITIYILLTIQTKPNNVVQQSQQEYKCYLKTMIPKHLYLSLDVSNKNVFLSKEKNNTCILKKDKNIKIFKKENNINYYLTLTGYTSVYNTEYPIVLDKYNKPIFNTFRIKKYDKDLFYLKTKQGFYFGYNNINHTIVFTKDKSKIIVFRIIFCD